MLMILKYMFFFYLFFMGVISFILSRKHLLSMLLSLEFMVLSMFFMFLLYLNSFENEMYFIMLFLIFSVCEGVLGISIMVSLIRTHGNDYFSSFSILQC